MTSDDFASDRIDTTRPAAARRYDALRGGKDNFDADRASAAELLKIFPEAAIAAGENRAFLARAVTYMARQLGVTQFLDIGCGLPQAPTTLQIAQAVDRRCRAVYVDNDILVVTHGRALLASPQQGQRGRAVFVPGDLRSPAGFLSSVLLSETLDLGRPVGVIIAAVLPFILDSERPYEAVAQVMEAMPAGSCLALSHGSPDFMSAEQIEGFARLDPAVHGPFASRDKAAVGRFFDGLLMVDPPGLVATADWLRPADSAVTAQQSASYAGLAVKPGAARGGGSGGPR